MEVWELRQRQALPLDAKVEFAKKRIHEWYEAQEGRVYVSFSGGKDSTVLLDIVRSVYPGIPAVFSDTGLEFPEIKEFVRGFSNVITVRPERSFRQVIERYGYPVIAKPTARKLHDLQNPTERNARERNTYLTGVLADGRKAARASKLPACYRYLIDAPFKISHRCCEELKKKPLHAFERKTGLKPIVGVMACESDGRERAYLKSGCNVFTGKTPMSRPLSIWTEQDVLAYVVRQGLKLAPVYGDIVFDAGAWRTTGERRTGCIFCLFGIQREAKLAENRFQRLARTHPKLHRYCMEQLGIGQVLDYMKIPRA